MTQNLAPQKALRPLRFGLFPKETLDAARWLLGQVLVRRAGDVLLAGRIVETEAYTEDDPASHSFGGTRTRNLPMFGPPGTAYVYRSYGIHHCMNVVTGEVGVGAAVLIRAIEPILGIADMCEARGLAVGSDPKKLCSGPGKLCQAMRIGTEWNGCGLFAKGELYLATLTNPVPESHDIITTTRIGITKGADLPRRFFIAGNAFVSRGIK
jgi:DNA-3-methyladenine glycosylase